jgi:L-cysteate sulfo-lyase
VPADEVIRSEVDVDERFIGEDYAVPSRASTEAIQELARTEGVFVGPVYTGKGFAGMLDHIRSGRVPSEANVAFVHTGDTANLFESLSVVGDVTAPPVGY